MMLKRYYFFLFLIPHLAVAQFVDSTEENYKAFYYQNGSISSEGKFVDGKPDRYWITYYENGLRKSEGNRLNFELDGSWIFYDKKGNKDQIISYKNGTKEGPHIYYKQCFISKVEPFENGVINGTVETYFLDSNKILKSTTPHIEGRKEGIAFEYGKDGRIVTILNYKKGFLASKEEINRKNKFDQKIGLWRTFYQNGKIEQEERYKQGQLNGYLKKYDPSGKLISAQLYIMGELQSGDDNAADFDIFSDYYPDGTVKSNITYNKSGKKDGVAQYYDQDGNISKSEFYINGRLISKGLIDKKGVYQGLWETYYLSGKLKSKGEYKSGLKYGKWIYYFENGKIEQEGYYDQAGRYTGEWKWYHDNGKLLRTEQFVRGIEDGYLEEYDRYGNLITKGEYLEGEKEGEWFYKLNDHEENGKYLYGSRNGYWEFDYPNGKRAFEGSFEEGRPHGKHKYYNENGVLIKEEEYNFGERTGRWKWYNELGAEITTIIYKNGEEDKIDGEKVKFTEIK